jgi:NitT/TauT family transport system substrate-binding protein
VTFRLRSAGLAAVAALLAVTAACGTDSDAPASESDSAASTQPAEELRLGFFANVTHATPLVGVTEGFYTTSLGDTKLTTQVFNAGPSAIEALLGGSLDASYIGPNPAINAFAKSNGEAIRIVAGTTSGGAALVVKPEINGPDDLRGTTLATPQLGNTQDVALRAWLKEEGLETSPDGGGDVTISPTENATTLQLFQDGAIQGAWLPEPWASRLVLEAGAKVLVDEATLWPEGRFVTTHLIVRTEFLDEYPETVKDLLEGHVETTQWIEDNQDQAKSDVNGKLAELSGKPLPQEVIDRAWENLTITVDPIATSLRKSASDAVDAGLTEETELRGIYDLGALNAILESRGLATVSDGGLGSGGSG